MDIVKVDFNNHQLEVIEDNQSIVVKDICEAIGIEYSRQVKRIKADESYESKLIKVQTRGGLQEVFTIPLSKLNGWLFSINPNKVKPEVKQKLIEYKKECFNVLNNYFNQGIAVNHRISPYQISGYKSQIAQHNKKINQLEDRIISLSSQLEKAKINNINNNSENIIKLIDKGLRYDKLNNDYCELYSEYVEMKATVKKIFNVVDAFRPKQTQLKLT